MAERKKKMGFVDEAVDTVARKMKIGGLETKDGGYVATSDLSPEDREKVEKLGKRRDWKARSAATAVSFRQAKQLDSQRDATQAEINRIYAEAKK